MKCADCSAEIAGSSYECNSRAAADAGWLSTGPLITVCAYCGRLRAYERYLRYVEEMRRAVQAERAAKEAKRAKRNRARKAQRKARK